MGFSIRITPFLLFRGNGNDSKVCDDVFVLINLPQFYRKHFKECVERKKGKKCPLKPERPLVDSPWFGRLQNEIPSDIQTEPVFPMDGAR